MSKGPPQTNHFEKNKVKIKGNEFFQGWNWINFHSKFRLNYRQTCNMSRNLVGNKSDHSDIVGASPVAAAPTTFSFST